MSTTETLPEVASNFNYACKKCDTLRYHKVLAHPTKSSAKLQCEVCGSKKTYKLATKKKTTRKRTKKVEVDPKVVWTEYKEKVGLEHLKHYAMKTSFRLNSAIDHPKFGVGFVRLVVGSRIEVVFEDGVRNLVHGRV